MGALTQGLAAFDCATTCAGGVKRVWLANYDDIDLITFDADGSVTAITMLASAVFYELKFKVNTKQLNEAYNTAEDGCGTTLTQTLTGIAPCYNQDTRTFLQEAAQQSCCGMVAIIEENSGFVGMIGYIEEQHVRLGPGTQTDTGANLTDQNQVTLELVCTCTVDGAKTLFQPGVAGIPV